MISLDERRWKQRLRMYDSIYIVTMILGATIAGLALAFAAGVFV